jgi:hypothetical protein
VAPAIDVGVIAYGERTDAARYRCSVDDRHDRGSRGGGGDRTDDGDLAIGASAHPRSSSGSVANLPPQEIFMLGRGRHEVAQSAGAAFRGGGTRAYIPERYEEREASGIPQRYRDATSGICLRGAVLARRRESRGKHKAVRIGGAAFWGRSCLWGAEVAKRLELPMGAGESAKSDSGRSGNRQAGGGRRS